VQNGLKQFGAIIVQSFLLITTKEEEKKSWIS
jgi:hypothetical protein